MGSRSARHVTDLAGLPGVPVLIYDSDCGFCTTSARWLQRRFRDPSPRITPWQALDLEPLGLTVDDVTCAAWWVDEKGTGVEAHLAIAASLGAGRRGWPLVGLLLRHPPIAWLAAPIYRSVARNRQRLPGGSDACARPAPPGSAATPSTSDAGARRSAAEVVKARVVAFGLVAVIITASLLGLEWWPLSGFRLFSLPRTSESVSWQLRAVDPAGGETAMNLSRLPPYDSGSLQITQRLPTMDQSQQQAVISAWMRGLGMDPGRYSLVRVYRVDGQVPTGSSQPQEPPTTTEVLEIPLP